MIELITSSRFKARDFNDKYDLIVARALCCLSKEFNELDLQVCFNNSVLMGWSGPSSRMLMKPFSLCCSILFRRGERDEAKGLCGRLRFKFIFVWNEIELPLPVVLL